MDTEPHEFPKLEPGTPITLAFEISFARPYLGWVMVAKKTSCQVLTWNRRGQPLMIADCRYRHDPRIKENPNWLAENPRGRAIFDLTAAEMERRELHQQVQGLLEIVAQQSEAIKDLRLLLSNPPKPNGAPKRRGRPPKQTPAETEADETSQEQDSE